jgi:hypothetical protein
MLIFFFIISKKFQIIKISFWVRGKNESYGRISNKMSRSRAFEGILGHIRVMHDPFKGNHGT